MNIAFPAFFIFLLILPGALFRITFYRTEKTELDYTPFGRYLVSSLMLSGALHALWVYLIEHFSPYDIKLDLVLELLLGKIDDKYLSDVANNYAFEVFFYFASIYLIPLILGFVFRSLIISKRLDKDVDFLKFDTPWYYLFTNYMGPSSRPDGVFITTILDLEDGSFLFTGLLVDYFFDKNGVLDRLVLAATSRRKLAEDLTLQSLHGDQNERFYKIKGDLFVLRYSEMKTLNVEYFWLEVESAS